jgi:Mg-chelatase subunit ChlD
MNLSLDQPGMLWLGLVIVPIIWLGWRAMRSYDLLRRLTSVGLRCALLALVVLMLAGPRIDREHDHLTVIGLVDVSGSVQRFVEPPPDPQQQRRSIIQVYRAWLRQATDGRDENDRFGLVVFDGQATAIAAPTTGDYVDDNLDLTTYPGTNIADAINLGLALFPTDTARRLVLISDGNETLRSAVEAARRAAADTASADDRTARIPIDIVPLTYRDIADAQILRLDTPTSAQPGQTVTVRMLVESTAPMRGTLTLLREGVAVDINGPEPGRGRRVQLPVGQSVHTAQVKLGETPVNRFEAIFEPDVGTVDTLPQNNRAEAFTPTPSRGAVLVVESTQNVGPSVLSDILRDADLPVTTITPEQMPVDLLSLQNYDLIALNNIAAFDLERTQHELLARYVNDLGGGLLLIGGRNAFGAGGWKSTALEPIIPLELDPPREIRTPSAALVLVLDKSGSMNFPVAGARASQQNVANEAAAISIESLRRDTLVGVIAFDEFAHTVVPLQRNDDPEALARMVRRIQADGGTDLQPPLLRALDMLENVDAEKKRVVVLTDGKSDTTDLDGIVRRMVEADIKLTTISIGDQADDELLAHLADVGQGEFYPVRNPRILPRVLVDSVQVINSPLIKEVSFTPRILATGSTLTAGLDNAPSLGGLVVTAPLESPDAVVEMSHPEGEPLLAHWQAGLGRVAAFTSDLGGPWSQSWIDWPTADAFWVQLARRIIRPAFNRDYELIPQMVGDQLFITLEALDDGAGNMDYLQVEGTVYPPDGPPLPVKLEAAAPGQYVTSIAADQPGNYIVALNPRKGQRTLAPVIGGATQTNNPEFRRYEPNPALLERIRELTGGRVLSLADAQGANLYDRTGMPRSMSSLPVASTLALWAVLLLLLDVASRRLAWSAATLRELFLAALARVVPSRVKGDAAVGTLSALRVSSERVTSEITNRPDPGDRPAVVDAAPRAVKRDMAPDAPVADAQRVQSALDAVRGRGANPAPDAPPAEETSSTMQDDAAPDETGSSETASSLLAAKRRARDQLDNR